MSKLPVPQTNTTTNKNRNPLVSWLARGAGFLVVAALALVGLKTFGEPPILNGSSPRRGLDARIVDQRARPDRRRGDVHKWQIDSKRPPKPMKVEPERAPKKPDPEALPYPYAKVTHDSALRLYRLPSAREKRLIARAQQRGKGWPSVVQKRMDGIYFLALDRARKHLGEGYYRTVAGRYVLERDIEPVTPPTMRGERLGGTWKLPVAFVFGEDRAALCKWEGELEPCGSIKKHARFRVADTVSHEEKEWIVAPSGRIVERSAVRIARRIDRPEGIPGRARWMHVNLAQQTLVAYQGDRPVFVTLISSGRKGHYTPTGLYRITKTNTSVTMQGTDPDEGWYEVAEVPWTLWYRKRYAVHGAYWHNDFGNPRSHGCTNLAPMDARWLFRWISRVKTASWVYFSAESD